VSGEDPSGWSVSGRSHPGATVRIAEISGAPEGRRVAEISLQEGGEAIYGLAFEQDLRLEFWTTYDLSVWVRGIDLVSQLDRPRGFGRQCGLFFWVIGPSGDHATRAFPAAASPDHDGNTPWQLRTMRFTTPPRAAYADRSPDGDERLHLQLRVQLFGTGTIQVDDIRIARSDASPPPPRRLPGRLALIAPEGKPLFGLGLFRLPTDMTWRRVAAEKIFNFSDGGGDLQERRQLGIPAMLVPTSLDPACRGCGSPNASQCIGCRLCPDEEGLCGAYSPQLLNASGSFLVWLDEENNWPDHYGDLNDMVESARRIRADVVKVRPEGPAMYIFTSNLPGGVYFNTYGWDDLARYHASEAFDIVSVIRRGGNPPLGALGGLMSEYPETSVNGIRNEARRLADDVTDSLGHQAKSVWMLVNGGNFNIITDRTVYGYRFAPHNAAELLAMRPSRDQLRYMLYASVLNGVTGLLFYQDDGDTPLTRKDPFWSKVLIPCAAELATLEKETGFLTRSEYNGIPYRLTGNSQGVDSMLKEIGESWILAVANSSADPSQGVEFQPLAGWRIAGPVERLLYRHDSRPANRKIEALPAGSTDTQLVGLDLPGYGVALYRFRLIAPGVAPPPAASAAAH
ncbi:MAG: hypothetical protein L0170_13005, partial [Acidobacteria bacterium]|nr:hypothetical protein [Acidobacteriota bacterium]